MIRVESYLLVGGDFHLVESYRGCVSDPQYVEGAIQLEINGVMILTLELFDYVDQLWAYIAQGLEALTTQDSWKTYFPDQPVELSFRTDDWRHIKIEVFIPKGQAVSSSPDRRFQATAPYKEFIQIMCEAGLNFFNRMKEIVPSKIGNYEKQMQRLRSAISSLETNRRDTSLK